MKKAEFFIEGQEHLRFVEPYISLLEEINFDLKIVSLENLNFSKTMYYKYFQKIDKSNLKKYFRNINTNFLITTTPGVGSYYFPLSNNNKVNYIYVFHSLVSPNEVYLKNSFKNFDFIFSPNSVIAKQLKFCVKKSTTIFEVGYPVLSYYEKIQNTKHINSVLIAPSWGKESFLFNFEALEKLADILRKKYDEIILRPHPMHLNKIKNINYFESLGITIDINKDLNYLKNIKLLITDWSGISLEYYYLNKNPIIFVDTPKKIRRKINRSEKKLCLIENKVREIIGIVSDQNFTNFQVNNSRKVTKSNQIYLDKLYSPEFQIEFLKIFFSNF